MARNVGTSIENSFVKGLITEATGMNFPENACTETENCVFTQIGEVYPRLGIDLESSATVETVSRASSAITTFLWNNVAGEGSRSFVVTQIGSTLRFYVPDEGTSLSDGLHSDTVDLTDFEAPNAPTIGTSECQFASGNGLLFVTHPYLEAFYVSYDSSTDAISATQIDIQIRDFEGVDDGLDVDERPTSTLAALAAAHNYNLRNQGWSTTNLTAWDTAQTTMPSNADVSWYYKDADDAFDFTTATISSIEVGNTPATKGHFILNLYDQDRTDVSGVSGVTGFSTGANRCATCAFFGGRIFYSGLAVEEYNSSIFFSQIVENTDQYGKCYQRNDPTSELAFDLLPSDGGEIKILDAGRIIKMVPVFGQLLVYATNGIWAISGSEGIGFTATDYTVGRVSSSRCLSHSSFVDADSMPIWWTADGIYTLQFQSASSTPVVQSLTDSTIKTFFDGIPVDSKIRAKGYFNPVSRIIQWVYSRDAGGNILENYNFDSILNLNTLTGAFYPWYISQDAGTKINGITVIEAFGGNLVEFEVQTGASGVDDVQSDGDDVVVISTENPSAIPLFKYLVSTPNGANYDFSFAEQIDTDLVDWAEAEGSAVEYDAYLVSGYKVRGDLMRKFQANYVSIFTRNDSDQAYSFQGRWNYANSGDTGRWTSNQIVNIPAGSYDYQYRRLKCRGHGLALQFKIAKQSGAGFNLIGWSAYEGSNQQP